MDRELEKRLRAIEGQLVENHRLLVRIRRVQRHGNLFRLVYWLILLAVAFGAFYFINPYLKQLERFYQNLGGEGSFIELQNSNLGGIKKLFQQLNAGE